jgi:drug/metabolite transporter (DMT)-like permease
MNGMKTFLFVLVATVFEAAGDAVIRKALQGNEGAAKIGLYAIGAVALALYGTCLNLAPVEFAEVVGLYIATLFVMFQVTNYVFFRVSPNLPVGVGGVLIVAGGLIVAFWKPALR